MKKINKKKIQNYKNTSLQFLLLTKYNINFSISSTPYILKYKNHVRLRLLSFHKKNMRELISSSGYQPHNKMVAFHWKVTGGSGQRNSTSFGHLTVFFSSSSLVWFEIFQVPSCLRLPISMPVYMFVGPCILLTQLESVRSLEIKTKKEGDIVGF